MGRWTGTAGGTPTRRRRARVTDPRLGLTRIRAGLGAPTPPQRQAAGEGMDAGHGARVGGIQAPPRNRDRYFFSGRRPRPPGPGHQLGEWGGVPRSELGSPPTVGRHAEKGSGGIRVEDEAEIYFQVVFRLSDPTVDLEKRPDLIFNLSSRSSYNFSQLFG